MEVWKYPVPRLDSMEVQMPAGAQILTVQVQGVTPVMWALVDPSAAKETRRFYVLGTGHPSEDRDLGRYVGSFQLHGGALVFHLFEEAQS